MTITALSGRVRRATLIALLGGIFFALTPLHSLAAGTVTLAWDPSPGTNVIANYKIYYGAASTTYTNVVAAGTNLTVSIPNLVVGTTYYFAATAVDTFGLESDYSTEVSSLILVKLTNQPPTLNPLANVTINETAGLQTVNLSGIASGATNEIQTLTVTSSSSNPSLIPTPTVSYSSPSTTGSITFSPVALAFGSAIITVTVYDGGASNNIISRTFTVTVNPVNQPPTLTPLANVTINENAGLQTVNLSGITSGATNEVQTLTVTAASSNPSLIPTPAVSYSSPNTTGSITFTPVALASGSTTITVTVNDGAASNNVVSRSFLATVIQTSPRPTSCTYAFSLSPTGFTANAASGAFTVSTDTNCVWSIAAPSWVSLDSTNGIGAYAGTFIVDANTGLSRTGLVSLIGGATNISCTLTQQALATGAVALVTPLDGAALQHQRLQFSWSQSDPAAAKYYLWINRDGSNYLNQWIEGATNWTAPTDLPAGNYTWTVETWNPSGYGPWSTNSTFTIQGGVPNAVALISPAGSAAANTTQRYTWKTDPAATMYELYISKDGQLFLAQWFTLADSVVNIATGSFAVDVSGHGPGAYQWYVIGWSPDGYGPWSSATTFSIGAVSLVTPTNDASLQTRRPQFSWSQSDPAATSFEIELYRNGSVYLAQWIDGTTNWTPDTDLSGGNYTWRVDPWGPAGYGPWSTNSTFTIQGGVPNAVAPISPAGSVAAGAIQRYTWKTDPAATMYELYISKDGQLFLAQWFTLADSVVDSTTGSFAVDVSGHGLGAYQWCVIGWSPDGYGCWSDGLRFQIP